MFKRKTIKKIIFFFIWAPVVIVAAFVIYNKFFMKADMAEANRCYDLLSKHGKATGLLALDLGMKGGDNLQTAIDRIKEVMGLSGSEIYFVYHDKSRKNPAYITDMGNGIKGIAVSEKITKNREQFALLTHELCHIYVWEMNKSLLLGYDEEKVVDSAGIFLGLGVLTLNGQTDDIFFIPGGEYEAEKKFFGYLKPDEFGYLLARYCAEHGVEPDNIKLFLNPSGRKYFSAGQNYLAHQDRAIIRSTGEVTGVFWCPKCGSPTRISLKGKLKNIKCGKCGG